jgi:hypothetical protein
MERVYDERDGIRGPRWGARVAGAEGQKNRQIAPGVRAGGAVVPTSRVRIVNTRALDS